jgi:hypothetical protein
VAALRAERVVVDGTPAESLPCGEGGACARDVRDTWEGRAKRGATLRWLATCGKDARECDDAWLTDADVRTVVVRASALVQLTARLLGVARVPHDLPATWGAPTEPRAIGVEQRGAGGGASRDVFLSLRPEREVSAAWLALRERAARPALVVVTTTRRLDPELVARHGPMDRVELLALDQALALESGAVALTLAGAGMRALAPERATNDVEGERAEEAEPKTRKKAAAHVPLRKTRGLALPPVATWRDLRVCLVNPTTVRFDAGGKYARFTAAQLGLASGTTQKPTRAWMVLAMTCDHGGLFTYVKFDKRWGVVRRCVSRLGLRMQELFGVEEPPFERPWNGTYRAKFIARVGVPGSESDEGTDDD